MADGGGSAAVLLPVTVTSGSRRLDLVLPAVVPVAELVPELARCVGVLSAGAEPEACRLVTAGGRVLSSDMGLSAQGVRAGGVLTVATHADVGRCHDDLAEAVAEAVEAADRAVDRSALVRRTAAGAGYAYLTSGVAAVLLLGDDVLVRIAASGAALALALGAVLLSRTPARTGGSTPVTWAVLGCLYGAAVGAALVPHNQETGGSLPGAGAGCVMVALLTMAGRVDRRVLLAGPALLGVVLLAIGVVQRVSPFEPDLVFLALAPVAVVCGTVLQGLALAATATGRRRPLLEATVDGPIDGAAVSADVRLAHDLLLAMTGAVGALAVLLGPVGAARGGGGAAVAALTCVLVALRTRRLRAPAVTFVGAASGLLGLLTTAACLEWLHPTWRGQIAVAVVALGLLLAAGAALLHRAAPRLEWVLDLVETTALVAVVPAVVAVVGCAAMQGVVTR